MGLGTRGVSGVKLLAPSPLVGEGWGEGGNRPAADTHTQPPYRVIADIVPGRTAGEGVAGVGRELLGIITDSFNNKQT